MAGYLSRMSPIPGFPSYTGPHSVGTIDVELPVSSLDPQSPAPSEELPTVQYRIFYPCVKDAKGKPINWIPKPQRGYVSAYARFLGAGNYLAEFISLFPRILHYITIPVIKNAPLLPPNTSTNRWPVMVFSHGLGGTRNTYSHLVGSLASHGVVVVCPEHRDGSTPISYIREAPSATESKEKTSPEYIQRSVEYTKLSHTPSPEVEEGRNKQLKIRLWELGLIHDSLLKIDQGQPVKNCNTSAAPLDMLKENLDVHTPGKITFAGHSFGAATITQFVKSVFYLPQTSEAPKDYEPLFTPSSRSPITQQITANTPVILLDVWCLPLRAKNTRWLWDKPFPCYSENGPGGKALLSVESQAFFKWRVHLKTTKRLLSPDPSSQNFNYMKKDGTGEFSKPNFYYAGASAHLSQSDFGMLFPWVVKKVFAVEEPERVMRLNTRAVLQLLRSQNIEVSATSAEDMEFDSKNCTDTKNDTQIFGKEGETRAWHWLDTNVNDMGDVDEDASVKGAPESNSAKMTAEPSEVVIGNEIMQENSKTSERL